MKELELEFVGRGEVRGFLFRQLERLPFAYLYEVRAFGEVFYEVFERRENDRYQTVSYPSSKAFGVWAYYIGDLARAKEKALDVNERVKSRRSSMCN